MSVQVALEGGHSGGQQLFENIKVTVCYNIYFHIESYFSSRYGHNEMKGKTI